MEHSVYLLINARAVLRSFVTSTEIRDRMGRQFEIPALTWSYINYFRKSENFSKKKKRTEKDHGLDSEINYS